MIVVRTTYAAWTTECMHIGFPHPSDFRVHRGVQCVCAWVPSASGFYTYLLLHIGMPKIVRGSQSDAAIARLGEVDLFHFRRGCGVPVLSARDLVCNYVTMCICGR